MKQNTSEPVLVLANRIGLWRHYDEAGELTYAVKSVDDAEIRMRLSEWDLLVSAMKSDEFAEERIENRTRFRSAYPPQGGSTK